MACTAATTETSTTGDEQEEHSLPTGALNQAPIQQQALQELAPVIREFAPAMRDFGRLIVGRLVEKLTARLVRYTASEVFGAKGGGASRAARTASITTQADGRLAANL